MPHDIGKPLLRVVRVKNNPSYPGSEQMVCGGCRNRVWVSKAAVKEGALREEFVLMCESCAPAKVVKPGPRHGS
jgi:hypothetical protein